MKQLEPHPFAAFLPLMTEAEFASLKSDVLSKRKFEEPAKVYQGKLLDGRNRQRVAIETGIKLPTTPFKGSDADAIRYVYSRANRRNLTDSQKAAAAVNFLPHFEAEAKGRMAQGVEHGSTASKDKLIVGKSRDFAGSLFGVSGRYVQDAKALKEGDPKLFRQVFDGAMPITRAKSLMRRAQRVDVAKALHASGRVGNIDDCLTIVGDAAKELSKLPRRKARLIFTDPPYNLGFKYLDDPTRDQLSPTKYLNIIRRVVAEAKDVLTPDGAICLMICEEWVHHFGVILEEAGLHLRRLIVWHESFGQAGNKNFGRTCRFIWYAVKDEGDYVFDETAALVESKRQAVYADARAMPGGKVADALWDFSRLAGTFGERLPDAGIPTQLPVALVKRAISIFTEYGDTVVDCFGGTGTTPRAALSLGRKCVYIDRSKKYAAIHKRELALAAGANRNNGKES